MSHSPMQKIKPSRFKVGGVSEVPHKIIHCVACSLVHTCLSSLQYAPQIVTYLPTPNLTSHYSLEWRLKSWSKYFLLLVWIWRCVQVSIIPDLTVNKLHIFCVLSVPLHVCLSPIFFNVKRVKMFTENVIIIVQISEFYLIEPLSGLYF